MNMKGEINQLDQKARDQRNAYMKEWRKRNKDKVKAAQIKYWEQKATKQKTNEDGTENG